jgi:hypothetical protein
MEVSGQLRAPAALSRDRTPVLIAQEDGWEPGVL